MRPGPLPANGGPPDPSLATLIVIAVGVTGMVILALLHRVERPTRRQRFRKAIARRITPGL